MNPIRPEMGLHQIKDQIQLRFMGKQAKALSSCLNKAITFTRRQVPVRRNPYPLKRLVDGRPQLGNPKCIREKHWEEALWRAHITFCDDTFPWREIVSYQVMLGDWGAKKNNQGWGEIDLLAISQSGLPIPIEVKVNYGECILRAIIEAVAYGIALQEVWRAQKPPVGSTSKWVSFSSQWRARAKEFGFNLDMPARMDECTVVCAAPQMYWKTCIGDWAKHGRAQVFAADWSEIGKLISMLANRGFHVRFVSLVDNSTDLVGLPKILRLEELWLPRS
jgi:hypothetical protein